MKYTQQSLAIENSLTKPHIRGIDVTQYLFEADMLNRALFQLSQQSSQNYQTSLLEDCYFKAQEAIRPNKTFQWDPKTLAAYSQCLESANTIAGVSLLRIARLERILLGELEHYFKRDSDVFQKALTIERDHHSSEFALNNYIGNHSDFEKSRKIYALSGAEILAEKPNNFASFSEYLNLPYIVENKLLSVAHLIIAKSYAVRDLEKLVSQTFSEDGYSAFSHEIFTHIEKWRYDYLLWQKSATFVRLTGSSNAQYGGMTAEEAINYSEKQRSPLRKRA